MLRAAAIHAADIAKNVFQVHGIDSAGQTTLRNKLRRSELIG